MLAMALWPGGNQRRKIVSGKFPNWHSTPFAGASEPRWCD
jgi:hypothetical protein